MKKHITSFNLLLFASVGSLLADAHVFFEPYKEYIASVGIFIGVIFSIIGAYQYYVNERKNSKVVKNKSKLNHMVLFDIYTGKTHSKRIRKEPSNVPNVQKGKVL